jgi:hypothetical protein
MAATLLEILNAGILVRTVILNDSSATLDPERICWARREETWGRAAQGSMHKAQTAA